eukprot:TRINITY_DN4980_c0_g4_i2.p1 TRINITY_DN4980_c0_g4~~TRINITY_DN4980_c0_g4_i2.p1  ORF type:complete len:391 (-),score=85.53 TRINITY_DN4980_c0_g4_i2:134-1180(-)
MDPSRGPSPTPRLTQEEAAGLRGAKFSDLVVKCLIKQTKALHITINEVDLDCLLESIFLYLQELGMEEIRRRAGADDKPLRMVKTVLHELVKVKGPLIKEHLSRVPIDSDPQPIILAYIDLNLQTLAASGQLPAVNGSRDVSSSGAQHNWDTQLKLELTMIFKKIGDKQTSALGLNELYQFMHVHPEVDVMSYLQNASEAFRAYIRDGLAQVERNMSMSAAGSAGPPRTPSPTSMASQAQPVSTPTAYGNLKEKPYAGTPDIDDSSSRAGAEWRENGNAGGGTGSSHTPGIESWRDRLKNINAGSALQSHGSGSSLQGFTNSPSGREQGASRVAEIRSRMEQFKHSGD